MQGWLPHRYVTETKQPHRPPIEEPEFAPAPATLRASASAPLMRSSRLIQSSFANSNPASSCSPTYSAAPCECADRQSSALFAGGFRSRAMSDKRTVFRRRIRAMLANRSLADCVFSARDIVAVESKRQVKFRTGGTAPRDTPPARNCFLRKARLIYDRGAGRDPATISYSSFSVPRMTTISDFLPT